MSAILIEDIRKLSGRPYWRELQGKNILITGATGMLGAYLAYAAAEHSGAKLFLLCRNKSKARELFKDTGCTLIFQDVCEPLNLDEEIHYVLHTAGPVGPHIFEKTPVDVISANVMGTLLLLDFAVRHKCGGFAFASTHEVYGAVQGEQAEATPASCIDISNPRSCYILAKQTGENALVCAAKQYGLRTVSARFARIYGPLMNMDSGLFICQFIGNVLKKEPVHVRGELNLLRPLIYIADAADAMLSALIFGKSGEAYNVQGEELVSIGDIAGMMRGRVIADKPETMQLPKSGHWLNCDKLKSLGWQQSIPLERGLGRTIDYFASQRN